MTEGDRVCRSNTGAIKSNHKQSYDDLFQSRDRDTRALMHYGLNLESLLIIKENEYCIVTIREILVYKAKIGRGALGEHRSTNLSTWALEWISDILAK